MKTERKRLIIEEHHMPRLRAHVYLRFNEKRNAWALLAPEHVYWPDEISVAILQKLDGVRDVSRIIRELADDYDAPPHAVGPDVIEFLQTWADERLIGCEK